jgi:large subunit ribosomal protein L17
MRHRIAGKRLNRHMGNRNALRRNMVNQLFEYERIKTTKAKAEAIRGQAEKMITIAKNGNAVEEVSKKVHFRRLAASRMANPTMVKKLFDEIAPRYVERPGGYTRVIKLGQRYSDRAEMVMLELVE